jgi:hypothetical protein
MRELFVVRNREMIVPRPCFHAYTEFSERKTRKNAIVFGNLGEQYSMKEEKREPMTSAGPLLTRFDSFY